MNEGIDWPAWVQAVGSIVAIGAAIWIDRGSARRALDADNRRVRTAKVDWEAALESAKAITANLARSLGPVGALKLELDEADTARLIGNAVSILEAYLRTAPPDPDLALTLAAAREQLREPADAIVKLRALTADQRKRSYSTHLDAVDRVRFGVAEAAEGLERLSAEYRQEQGSIHAESWFAQPKPNRLKAWLSRFNRPRRKAAR